MRPGLILRRVSVARLAIVFAALTALTVSGVTYAFASSSSHSGSHADQTSSAKLALRSLTPSQLRSLAVPGSASSKAGTGSSSKPGSTSASTGPGSTSAGGPSTSAAAGGSSAAGASTGVSTPGSAGAKTTAPAAGGGKTSSSAPSKATSSAAADPSQPQDQNLVLFDDFTGSLANWWTVYNTTGSSQPTARVPSLISVSGGALHVATAGSSGSGLCLCGPGSASSSAYGRWDVRARLGANADHGFAILLWPNAENWPVGGEIDLAEPLNASRQNILFTVHYTANNLEDKLVFPGDYTGYHTFSVEWAPTYIKYWIDGALEATITDPAQIPSGAMHLALQAGADTSNPSATSAVMDVDWVKVFSR